MEKSKAAVIIYDKIADKYAEKFQKPSDHINYFAKLAKKGGKILDAGCGPGYDANYLASKEFEVIGVDLSKEMIKIAKRNFPKVKFKIADLRKMKFKKEYFDGIFAAYSLIHIPKKNIGETINDFYKFLKPDGILYIALQSGVSGEEMVIEPLNPKEKMFLNIMSESEITKILKQQKFKLLKKFFRSAKNSAEFDYTKLFLIARKT